jgi:hypothetical protein
MLRELRNTITAVTSYYQVYGVDIIYGGEGYTSDPTITFSAPASGGTTATITSVTRTNGVITAITFGTTGTRYIGQPAITISTSGSVKPAIVVAKIRNGSGYTSAPAIGFSGGGGSNAAATAYIQADLDTVTITANGSGYTSAPTVFIYGMNQGASATATVSSNQVTGITLSGFTNKYAEPPTVVIGGWPSSPSVSNGDQKFVGAFAVYNNNSNFVAFTCQGNYTVDWGDGTSNNYTSNTAAYKQYTTTEYAAISGQSEFRGYKVVIITITPQAGQNLTKVDLNIKHNQSGLADYMSGWLDVKVAGQNLTTLVIGGFGTGSKPAMLEQFEFVGSNTGLTSWVNMMLGCYGLEKIISLPPSTPTDLRQCFSGCNFLTAIPSFTTSGITNLESAFSDCRSLVSMPEITSETVTTFQSAFSNCYSLQYAPVRITSNALYGGSAFSSCASLIRIPPMNSINLLNTSNMFNGCRQLQEVPDLDLRSVTDASFMFSNCSRLRSVGYLNTAACTTLASMFSNCNSLKSIKYLDAAKASNLSGLFANCYLLEEVPVINAASATTLNATFFNCHALKSVSVINTALVTNTGSTFSSCYSLKISHQ